MSELRLAPQCSAKAGNLHHSYKLLTSVMMVSLSFFITICLVLCFSPPRQRSHYLRKEMPRTDVS